MQKRKLPKTVKQRAKLFEEAGRRIVKQIDVSKLPFCSCEPGPCRDQKDARCTMTSPDHERFRRNERHLKMLDVPELGEMEMAAQDIAQFEIDRIMRMGR